MEVEKTKSDVVVFTDLKAFYNFVQNVEYDVRVDREQNVWSKNEIIAKYKSKV